jgi:hypothetical protein
MKTSFLQLSTYFKRPIGFRSKRTFRLSLRLKPREEIQDWFELDEGDTGFQLLAEEDIAAAISFYLFSSALPTLLNFPFIFF